MPPLGEQRAIADYLDTETARIDALITKKRRLITLLEERNRDAWSIRVGNTWSIASRQRFAGWVDGHHRVGTPYYGDDGGVHFIRREVTFKHRSGSILGPQRDYPQRSLYERLVQPESVAAANARGRWQIGQADELPDCPQLSSVACRCRGPPMTPVTYW